MCFITCVIICIVQADGSYGRMVLDRAILSLGVMATLTAGKKVVTGVGAMLGPSRATLAVSKTEVALQPIAEGLSFLWIKYL